MSQYPPQYPPPYPPTQPPYGAPPPPSPEELQIPARRAGVMMIVLGTLAVLLGILSAYQANRFDPAQWNAVPEVRKQLDQQIAMLESAGLTLRGVQLFGAAVMLAVGAILGALGFSVRHGGVVAIICSIVLVSLVLLVLGIFVLASAAQGGAMLVVAGCSYAVPLALLGLLLVWLIRAARSVRQLAYVRQWSQWQAAQLEQARQSYQQTPIQPGPGPAAPPAAPTAPPAPPPGGYHQYPISPPPGGARPPDTGDPPDGPPAQG